MALDKWRVGACAAALALVFSGQSAFGETAEQRFQAPPREARPMLRWWWPGAAVEPDELRREIELMDKNGFSGAEIQSLTPNFVALTLQERAVVNDYAEPRFFEQVRVAADAAKARGMWIDYTLGSSWPSGGGTAITPELAFVELTMARTAVRAGPGLVKVTIPKRTRRLGALNMLDARVKDPKFADWAKRLDARARIVAVVAMKGDAPELITAKETPLFKLTPWDDVARPGRLDMSTSVVLTDKLRDDGTLDWNPPPGEWQVFVFKQFASDVGVLGAAGRGPQLILDHMSPEAFAAHAARVGDPLGKSPPGIRSTFVDSLELMQDIQWGPDFLEQFRRRRGYDLTPYLPLVLQPGWMLAWAEHYSPPYFDAASGEIGERVRADYRRTLSEIMMAGFIEPFVAWNRRQGLKSKFQAHGGAFDIVRGYGLVDIPETEDLVHDGDPLVMRFARSGAHLYGRKLVSAESLVWKDRPYDVTPDEMRKRIDLLISGGVNSIVMHGMNYRFHADEWPGWHAFQPSPFALGFSTPLNETNPVWPAVKPLATYAARLQSIMQAGEAVVPVAYFYGRYGYYVGIEDEGAGRQGPEKAFIAGGYDFDRINPESIAGARVRGRQLVARSGKRYGALVLPPLDGIRAETAEAIARLAEGGVPVIFTDRAPRRDEGMFDAARQDLRVQNAVKAALAAGARIVAADAVIDTLRAASVTGNLRFTGDTSGVNFVQRRVDRRTFTFVHNRSPEARQLTVWLPQPGAVTRWNAMDGRIVPVSASAADRGTVVPLALAAGEGALLALDPAGKPATVRVPTVATRIDLPGEGWALSVEGHAKRQPFASEFGAVSLTDWRQVPDLVNFAGTATYRRTVTLDAEAVSGASQLILDLGDVRDMASVTVNGRALPPAISAPFRVDITGAARAGSNDLVVTVANVPQNAMLDVKASGYKLLKPVAAGWIGPAAIEVTK